MYLKGKPGLLLAPVLGNSSKKRVRESTFSLTTPQDILPPKDRLPNNFPPPPVFQHSPSIRLGFNAYEQQQMAQKRVCLNPDPNYSYANMLRDQLNTGYMVQEQFNYPQQPNQFLPSHSNMHYPPHNQLQQYNSMPQTGTTCSTYLYNTSHPYTYTQMKENTNPNIPLAHVQHNTPTVTPPESMEVPPQSEPRENKNHQLSRGLQLITVSPEVLPRWVPLLGTFNLIFEVFAVCTRLPEPFSMNGKATDVSLAKIFYLRNPHAKEFSNPTQLKCVYWEVENPLLPMQIDKIYRVIGSFDVKNSFLKVFDARAAKMDETANWPVLVARSNRIIRRMPLTQSEI